MEFKERSGLCPWIPGGIISKPWEVLPDRSVSICLRSWHHNEESSTVIKGRSWPHKTV